MRAPLLRALAPLLPSLRLGSEAAAPLAVRGVKTTTGIVGLPVVDNAREVLKEQLQAVLDALAVIPESAEYRKSVEKTVQYKLQALASDQPDEQVEELLGRQLEEEIRMCQDELGLIPKMAEWKPWDVPEGHTVEYLEEHEVETKLGGTGATQVLPQRRAEIKRCRNHPPPPCIAATQEDSRQVDSLTGATLEAASHRHNKALLLLWGVASGTAGYVAQQQHGVPADAVLMVDATLWLGVVAAISLTEAWVKFRAPLLDRWVALDVGRRVFRSQYALEGGLAATAASTLWAQAGGSLPGVLALLEQPPTQLLVAAVGILLLEAAVVFPALDRRAKRLIVDGASQRQPAASLAPEQEAYVAELRSSLAGKSSPPAQLHLLSVVLALAKAGLLAAFVWRQLLALGTCS